MTEPNPRVIIGHNQVSYDYVIAEKLRRGLLLCLKECAVAALRDPRLGVAHRRVLAEIIDHVNVTSGAAFPGRKRLAERCRYSENHIGRIVSELMDLGYLTGQRKVPEGGRHWVMHYAVMNPKTEEIEGYITDFVNRQRDGDKDVGRRRPWDKSKSNVTNGGNVTPISNVASASNITKTSTLPPCEQPNVTPGAQTVTNRVTRVLNNPGESPDAARVPQARSPLPMAAAGAAMMAALNPMAAAAGQDVRWMPDGRIEVSGALLSELKEKFPDVDLNDGLSIVAGESITADGKPTAYGWKLIANIRRKFGYLQNDHRGRDKRAAAHKPTKPKFTMSR